MCVCVCEYYNCKKPQNSLPYLEPQHSAPPWETRPHLLKPVGVLGSGPDFQQRGRGTGRGGRGWGIGFGLNRFTAEGSFLLRLWPFVVVAAAKETAGSLSLALLRHIKASFSSLQPLGFEVGFSGDSTQVGRPAFECLSCTWVILEALALRRCVTGGQTVAPFSLEK